MTTPNRTLEQSIDESYMDKTDSGSSDTTRANAAINGHQSDADFSEDAGDIDCNCSAAQKLADAMYWPLWCAGTALLIQTWRGW